MDEEKPREAVDDRLRGREVDAETPGRAEKVAREARRLVYHLEDELPVGLHDHGEVLHEAEEGAGQRDFVGTAVALLRSMEDGVNNCSFPRSFLSRVLPDPNTASTAKQKQATKQHGSLLAYSHYTPKTPKTKCMYSVHMIERSEPKIISVRQTCGAL